MDGAEQMKAVRWATWAALETHAAARVQRVATREVSGKGSVVAQGQTCGAGGAQGGNSGNRRALVTAMDPVAMVPVTVEDTVRGTVADTVPAEETAAVMARGTATAAPDKEAAPEIAASVAPVTADTATDRPMAAEREDRTATVAAFHQTSAGSGS